MGRSNAFTVNFDEYDPQCEVYSCFGTYDLYNHDDNALLLSDVVTIGTGGCEVIVTSELCRRLFVVVEWFAWLLLSIS